MEYQMICDENDIPAIVQSVSQTLSGDKYRAFLFDDSCLEFHDYEVTRQMGKLFATEEEIIRAVMCLAERKYKENRG